MIMRSLKYDLTSGASGLTPDARIKAGTTSSFSLLLSSSPRLSPPFVCFEVLLTQAHYTAWIRDSSNASNVFGPTFLNRLSRFKDVATDVNGVFPLI